MNHSVWAFGHINLHLFHDREFTKKFQLMPQFRIEQPFGRQVMPIGWWIKNRVPGLKRFKPPPRIINAQL